MPLCYWRLCNCPTPPPDEACDPHGGHSCGQWNGQTITSETQVTGNIVQQLTAAIAEADADLTFLGASEARAQQLQADARRDQQKIENEVNNANSYSERKQAVADTEQAVEDSKKRRDEYQKIVDDSSGIVEKDVPAIDRGLSRLIIPFEDLRGYCACYNRKVNRLADLATRIQAEQATLNALANASWPNAKTAMVWALGSLAFPVMAGIGMVIRLGLVYLGFLPLKLFLPIIAALALLAVMVALAAVALTMLSVARKLVSARKRLAQLVLLYFRVQQISTCVKHEDGLEDEDENGDEEEGDDPDPDDSEWQKHFVEILGSATK